MYVINIMITIAISVANIIGSIITGRVPKVSAWHLMNDINIDLIDENYWYNEDTPYLWRSRNEDKKSINNSKLDTRIDFICYSDELSELSTTQLSIVKAKIKTLVQDYNRSIL